MFKFKGCQVNYRELMVPPTPFRVSLLPPLSNYKRQQLLKLRKFNVFLSIRKFLVYFLVKNPPIKIEK